MTRINTNVTALNSQRVLGNINQDFSETVGRLSSGFRINSASDDASGLGVANQLRADIKGLEQASRNAEQANSLLQIAEGGASEIEGALERLKELAVQSGSDNAGDRSLIDSEAQELIDEIDRIADTTKFQDTNLLDGSFGQTFSVDTSGGSDFTDEGSVSGVSVDVSQATSAQTLTVGVTDTTSGGDTSDNKFAISLADSSGNTSQQIEVDLSGGGEQTLEFDQFGVDITLDASNSTIESDLDTAVNTNGKSDLAIQSSSGSAEFMVSVSGDASGRDQVEISGQNLDLTESGLSLGSVDLSSKSGAETAISTIDSAIDTVNKAFGDIGAAQNRLDIAQQNTDTAIENFNAAESVIRDADIARQSTEFARLQIQQQAATSMLAQANSAPQQVLSLLQ